MQPIKFKESAKQFKLNDKTQKKLLEGHKGYIKFSVEKKNGKKRWIHAPHFLVKNAQKSLLTMMENPSVRHFGYEVINGFVPGQSILDNARPHVGKPVVLSIDLKNFFPSVHPKTIKSSLSNLTTNFQHVHSLVTTSRGRLPQGAPTSPMIANWCVIGGDRAMVEYCKEHRIDYTRYADDLTFSTHRQEITEEELADILFIINTQFGTGIRPAPNKIKFMRRHKQQRVTGIVVNEKLSIPRARRKQLRAFMHDCEMNGVDAALGRFSRSTNNIFGELSFLHLAHRDQAEKYIEQFKELL